LQFLFGQSLRTLPSRLVLIGLLSLLVTGCSGVSPLSLLTGGGPNVAANVQAGKTNTQTLGTTKVDEGQKIVRPQARDIKQVKNDSNRVNAESIKTVVVNEMPLWIFLVALIGWLAPTPKNIALGFINLFKRNN